MRQEIQVTGIENISDRWYLKHELTLLNYNFKYFSFHGIDGLHCRIRDDNDDIDVSFKCHENLFYRVKNNSRICFYLKKEIDINKDKYIICINCK